jgi:hypothetical protein
MAQRKNSRSSGYEDVPQAIPESGLILGRFSLDEAVTPRVAAQILGLTEKTLANWRTQRVGPPYIKLEPARAMGFDANPKRRNGPVRYPLRELLAWRDQWWQVSTAVAV